VKIYVRPGHHASVASRECFWGLLIAGEFSLWFTIPASKDDPAKPHRHGRFGGFFAASKDRLTQPLTPSQRP
jgi:hypothetical protein